MTVRKALNRIRALIDMGVYTQVNTRGFLGSRFDRRTAWCTKLLEKDLIHFVASDCHNCRERKPVMKTAGGKMLEIAGEETVERIVKTNVIKLIQNKYI